jgi:hypothetical protein
MIDSNVELIALTMILGKQGSTCSCGFQAEGFESGYGEPICLKCYPEWCVLQVERSPLFKPEYVLYPHHKLVRRFNQLLRGE